MPDAAYSIKDEYNYPELNNVVNDCYIKNRLLPQMDWYDKKSGDYQKKYKRIAVMVMALNGLIPVIILLADYGLAVKLLIAAISSAATVLASLQILNNYKDLWIQYRSNCELLKSLLHRFYAGAGEFTGKTEDEKFALLVELGEKYLNAEFSQWNAAQKTDNNPPTSAAPPAA